VARLQSLGDLTPIQTVVCVRLLLGESDKEIADCLGTGVKNVSEHTRAVRMRLRSGRGELWVTFLWSEAMASPNVVAR
jgi:DNA-binding CsgD family transcriptional regulator